MKKSTKGRVSSIDVAKKAGVSQSTVSRVFSKNSVKISEKTREKVLKAASELGYSPSMIASSLSKKSSNIIGIIMKQFSNPFHIVALERFARKFQSKGYSIMLFNSLDQLQVEKNLMLAMEYHVAGLIVTSARIESSMVDRYLNLDIPIFLFNRVSDSSNIDAVCCDNYNGARAVADYLIDKGHKELIYIEGDKNSSTNRDRKLGFFTRVKERGLAFPDAIEGGFSYDAGYNAGKVFELYKGKADAVFCASDIIAKGFIDYLKTNTNLDVPRDVSVIGFDGVSINKGLCHKFTTYRQPIEKMVDITVDLMISKIENFNEERSHYLLSGNVLDRGTVKEK